MLNVATKNDHIEFLLKQIWIDVLNVKTIDKTDEFTALGGNSLQAIKVIHKISEIFNMDLSLTDFFKNTTLKALTTLVKHRSTKPQDFAKKKPNIFTFGGLPLCAAQRQIYFMAQYQPGASQAYNVVMAIDIKGDLNIAALEKSFHFILDRHEILRASFKQTHENVVQIISNEKKFKKITVNYIEKYDINKALQAEASEKFDITEEQLIRINLLQLTNNHFILVITQHHLITDAWSIALLKKELMLCYQAFVTEGTPKLPRIKSSYAEFIWRQNAYLSSTAAEADLTYWQEKLRDFTETSFPGDYKRKSVKNFIGKKYKFSLNQKLVKQIQLLNAQTNSTPFMLVSAVISLLLSYYTHQDDVIFGFPVSGRLSAAFSDVLGMFLNTLVLRVLIDRSISFEEFLAQVKTNFIEAYAHQELPFERLVSQLKTPRCQNKNPLFQVMVVWQDTLDMDSIVLPNVTLTPFHFDNKTAKFDLVFEFIANGAKIDCYIEYDTSLYKSTTIARIALHFENLLKAILLDAKQGIDRISFISAEEKLVFLAKDEQQGVLNKPFLTMQDIFAKTVEKFPERIAIRYDGLALTYQQLNEEANKLAHYIRKIYQDDFDSLELEDNLIGVCLDRSLDLIIAMLAILKAGAAYVPLDPEWPQRRMVTIAEDANFKLIITKISYQEKLNCVATKLLLLDRLAEQQNLKKMDNKNPIGNCKANNLIYVIYTSGTTGKPKGVPQTHHNVARLFDTTSQLFKFSSDDIWALFHAYTFDFSVWEIWGAFYFGGCLLVPAYQQTRDTALFYQLVIAEKVTILNQTPSAFNLFLQEDKIQRSHKLRLRYIIFGGEALDNRILLRWWKRHAESQPILVNMYGITEITVHATFKILRKKDLKFRSFSNIGKLLPDLKGYVVDRYLQLVPIGVPGELLISGQGLSPGYLNHQELTKEKFIKNIFNPTAENARLYKTGDLVRWLNDSSLEYLGRIDTQLKVRGFRLEAGEIEICLKTHKAIKDCYVTCWQNNQSTVLVAYYSLLDQRDRCTSKEFAVNLRDYLLKFLPSYMVPQFFVRLNAIPLTNNMKLDLKALPAPCVNDDYNIANFAEPKNKFSQPEEILAKIWQKVLHINSVQLDDNFFSLGGDSITSVMVVAEARKAGFSFTVSNMFKAQTVRQLANYYQKKLINNKKNCSFSKLDPAFQQWMAADENIEAIYPLSALQAGMVYHSAYSQKAAVYLDVFCFYLMGKYDKADFLLLIKKLILVHPVLRTGYSLSQFAEPVQIVYKSIHIPFCENDLRNLPVNEQEQAIKCWIEQEKKHNFHYEQAPLFRICVHLLNENNFIFAIAFHHSILDGWSLATFMTQLLNNQDSAVKTDWNFKEFIALEKAISTQAKHKNFWQNELQGFQVTALPNSHRLKNNSNDAFYSYAQLVEVEVTEQLIGLANRLNVAVDEVLLAVHMKWLALYSGQSDVLSGVVFNGRPELTDINSTLGLFLNTLPFRIEVEKCSWKQLILLIARKKRKIYPHRVYPLSKIIQDLTVEKFFDVIFYFTHFHVFKNLSENCAFKITNSQYYERTNFPLAVNCALDPVSHRLKIIFNYEGTLYSLAAIKQGMETYISLLNNLVAHLDSQHISLDFNCFLVQENFNKAKHQVDLNNLAKHSISCLIAQVAQKYPQRTALIFSDEAITYRQLNEQANKLANLIQDQISEVGELIAVCAERSEKVIIAMLAILKSGNIYLPIDPANPPERINFILADANCKGLITEKKIEKNLSLRPDCIRVYLDNLTDLLVHYSPKISSKTIKRQSLAYVIYTSGSTGNPKGVMIKQLALLNVLYAMRDEINFTQHDVMLALTSFAFDISMLEIFLPLISGGTCVVSSLAGSKDPSWVKAALIKHKVTMMQATPSTWGMLFEQGLAELPIKITAICGGEELPQGLGEKLLAFAQAVWNVYGPTETTIWSTIHKISSTENFAKPAIGRPFANTKAYVLDNYLQAVPIGAVGNLYLSGIGLAQGYLNRPELTQEKFLANPFDNTGLYPQLYHTGDLARWLPNGCLEYISRSDYQIKIRGIRVEASEIELALLQYSGIKACVVLVKVCQNAQYLVAYLIKSQQNQVITVNQLRQHLLNKIPYYYLPDKYLFLEKFPLTQNEKIDRRKLLEIEFTEEIRETVNAKKLSSEQMKLANLWQNLLHVKQVFLSDDFFALGGNSILTLRLAHKICELFSVDISLKQLIENSMFECMFNKIISLQQGENLAMPTETISYTQSLPDPIIKFKTNAEKPPLFLVHPVGGNIFYYLPLIKLLPNNRLIYAIQDPGLVCRSTLFSSLAEMARFYIAAIKKYQPTGPYLMAGSSFGANMAVEIARQLKDQGEELAFVGLIDGWPQYPKEANCDKNWFKQNLLSQLQKMHGYFTDEDLPELFLDLHWHRQQLLVQHVLPNMADVKLTLFKAEKTMEVLKPLDSTDNNWERYCHSKPEIHLVKGDHFSMHFPPYDSSLAEAFKRCLGNIS